MKNLDLNAFGVSEMSQQELVEMDGGLLATLAFCCVALGLAYELSYAVGQAIAYEMK